MVYFIMDSRIFNKGREKRKRSNHISNILIYQQSYAYRIIQLFQKGKMTISPDKKFLEFRLQNGYRYEEKGDVSGLNNEFVRLDLKNIISYLILASLTYKKQRTVYLKRF
jgi:lipopolysaccharide export system permease protein